MPRTYQRKRLPDGSPNPRYRLDSRGGDRHTDRGRKRSGARLSKWDRAKFVAWDGEGATLDGYHEYVLLCNSESLTVSDPEGLGTLTVLRALIRGFAEHPGAVHVGFFFSYDANMIFRDIDAELLPRLWAGEWIWWRGFSIQWRANKTLSVSSHVAHNGRLRRVSGTVWDVGGFFQSAFVVALQKFHVADDTTIKAIAAKKLERPTFTTDMLPEITEYCQSECRYLVKLMEQLRSHFDAAGIRLKRWDGAGAAASALLDKEGVKAAKSDPPSGVVHAAQYAYFGGRVELLQYGHYRGPVSHYDINSAYPAATQFLPCLACGRWEHITDRATARRLADSLEARPDTFAVFRIRWNYREREPLYPFPWRREDGAIYFPSEGEGWYWSPEIVAARRWMRRTKHKASSLTIREAWVFRSTCTHQPFAFVPALYEQRRAWKREGNGAEKAAKLALNSLYGKMAQRIGHAKDAAPSYHQLEWAGWITSTTRAKLLDAVADHERDVIAFATDAVYSLVPLSLPCSDRLGDWDAHTHDGGTWVQSGVYWIDDGAKSQAFSRGFDRESLSRDAVVNAWKKGRSSIDATLTRFVGMGSCINAQFTAARWDQWRQWITSPRRLQLTPANTKRDDVRANASRRAWRALVPTVPALPANVIGKTFGGMSAPIALPWSDLAGLNASPELRAAQLIESEAEASVN